MVFLSSGVILRLGVFFGLCSLKSNETEIFKFFFEPECMSIA